MIALVHVLLPTGVVTTLRLADGQVATIGIAPQPGDEVVDAGGRLALPAMAEAHAHLDKAYLSETVANPTGDLMGAIVAMESHRHLLGRAETEARAERAARRILANGATAIRTHADVTEGNGLVSIEALVAVRERLRDLVHIEVVALAGWPVTGSEGAQQRALLADAVAMGVDAIGGCPHLEDDSHGAIDVLLSVAADAGLPVDLHTDEHLDAARSTLTYLARAARDFPHRVAASHCVSLGLLPEHDQRRTAEALAEAEVSVISLPASNLYLQGREQQEAMPRALTALKALREAGVTVAAGWDNLQDPFNPLGRGDCLETAALMVMAGHLLPDQAYATVSGEARRVMGLPVAGVDLGDAADLVLLPVASVREAIADAPSDRIVVRAGRVVSG